MRSCSRKIAQAIASYTCTPSTIAHLDRVLLSGLRGVSLRGRGDRHVRAVGVAGAGGVFGGEQVELVGAVAVLLVVDVHHAHLVSGAGGAHHGLGHDDVVVTLVVGAALLAVGAQGGHPLTALVLVVCARAKLFQSGRTERSEIINCREHTASASDELHFLWAREGVEDFTKRKKEAR